MSLIPTVYRSTDPGAPVLSGTAGSFAALMDAVLVSGYGTGPDAKPGLGWVRAFSDGHKRAYQNSLADGGTGMFWRIDDSNAQWVVSAGFHTMSDIDSGVDGFASMSGWGKSITANTTAREWVVVGNGRSVYVFIKTGWVYTPSQRWMGYFIGDYECFSKSYQFNFALSQGQAATVTTGQASGGILVGDSRYGMLRAARDMAGSTLSIHMIPSSPFLSRASIIGGGGYVYPYPPTGGALLFRVVYSIGGYPFAMLPGLWAPEHNRPFINFSPEGQIPGVDGEWLVITDFYGNTEPQGLIRIDMAWEY